MAPLLAHLGYIPGPTSAQGAGTPAVPGWTAAYQATGPGAPGGTGAQYATTIKYFPSVAEGYPSFPSSWGSLTNLVAIVAASTLPMVPILCWGSAPTLGIPPATGPGSILSFLQSLPVGQACWFSYASEPESGSDLSGSAYVGNVQTFSNNLNTALASMRASTGSGFWNRTNFGYVHSGLLSGYSNPPATASGTPVTDPSYIPKVGTCDSYGMDLYRKGSAGRPASTDARVQGFVASVRAVIGNAATSTSFPEYGINGAAVTDAQAAQFMQQDLAYFTGSSRPFANGVQHWVYWYKVGNSGEAYAFSGAGRASEIAAWQAINTYANGGQGQNTITVTNPGLQTSRVGTPVSVQIAAADSNPALPLHYALGNTLLPPGLSLNANTGLITGVPTTAGTFSPVTVTVTDGTGAAGSASFTWQVNLPTAETVTMVNPGPQTSTKGLAITPLNIQASDSLGLALAYSATGLPAGLTISPVNGQITGTPSTISASTVNVTAASSTPVSASQSFTWSIVASVVTVASPGPQANATNDVVSLQITATDTAGLAVSFGATGLPTGLSISASGLITGTCSGAGTFNPVITGTDTAGSTGNVTFTWVVQAIVVTVASPGNVINNTFDPVSLQMVGRDSADQALTWTAGGTLPPGLAIASATGLITGEPTTAGVYLVTITATDVSLVTGSVTFTWTVNQAATVLVVSIAPEPGTDIYGNAYPAGVTVGKAGGTQTTIGLDGTLRYNAPVFTMPAMTAGWTAGGHATYALDVLGNLVVSFKDLLPGTDTDGTLIWPPGSLPPGFRPANSRRIVAYTDVLRVSGAAFESAALNFLPDGSIAVYGVALAATRLDLFHVIPLTF